MNTTIKKLDTNSDGKVSEEEFKQFWQIQKSKVDPNNSLSSQKSMWKGTISSNSAFNMAGFADQKYPVDPSLSTLQNFISQLEVTKDSAMKEQLINNIKEQLVKMEEQGKVVPKNLFTQSPSMKSGPGKQSSLPIKGQMINGGKGPNQDFNAGSAKAQTLELGTAKAQSFKAETWNGLGEDVPYPDASSLELSMMKEQNVQDNWDEINKNSKKGKQLMMLFFYYARLAESGDMGAIYQFMKFITYIISKDKAKQQIEMGKKLIQLQELSRQWTNKLLDLQTNTTDPSASSELMKTMTIVKSETDAIATSQKLISQMMEEMAQVVETLTNTTKGALEAYGRIMRTVSVIR